MNRLTAYLSLISTFTVALPPSPPPGLFSLSVAAAANVTFPFNVTNTARPPPDPWDFHYPPMHVHCFRYAFNLPLSPVVSIIQHAHLGASKEDKNTPLPGRGITYIGLVEPWGRLSLSIMNDPLITYGQWEETLLALRIFVGTFQPVEFRFQVAMDRGVGRPVSVIGSGILVAVPNLPNDEAS